MFIVADSGSTKAKWAFVENGETRETFITKGLNPYFINSDEVYKELTLKFPENKNSDKVQSIYFYGAGCSAEDMKQIILKGLKKFFKRAEIIIESDLLGAARALFYNRKGLVAILGTGSSTCFYDGEKITTIIKSLGYTLGDEGSGAHLGKLIITDYLHNDLSNDLKNKFDHKYRLTKDQILFDIYKKPQPNKYLASFTNFLNENKDHPHIQKLIQNAFYDLFNKYICKFHDFKKYNLGFVGSVAHVFKLELESTAKKFDLKIDQVIKDPLEMLIEYHKKNNTG